ncbi:DUF2062 domain-containing protein [Halosolutus gelatinilyticus]|uniref:DUF2062 domain-containing protein n=1 Tax=Halosolutus gelatinilyticus TaxID=2931975 RepID=UPI001FF5046C|nr:DUF2062 domain-containing protein [Halosolutus gelatinilyticus]
MIRRRLNRYRDRARSELRAAFRTDHTPHQIGASFAVGIFITTLPTGGLGIGLFFVFAALWSWVNKPAIFASVAVLNPFVKPAVYVASYHVGGVVLGTRSILSSDPAVDSAGTAVGQTLLGNILVGIGLAVLSYVAVVILTRIRRGQQRHPLELSSVSAVLDPFRRR